MNFETDCVALRRAFLGASLAAFLVLVGSASAHRISTPPLHWVQQDTQASEVSGKVTAIGSDKRSIQLEVTDNKTSGNTMQFILNDNTRVTGRVSVGTMATVDYRPTPDGKLLALNIAPRTQQQ